jgi:hypothetical protein
MLVVSLGHQRKEGPILPRAFKKKHGIPQTEI